MAEYTTTDIIDYCLDGDVVNLQKAINDIMSDRITELLDAKKIEVAKTIFNPEE
jgi:hypothetical protein